jgi:hypothetical protein
VDEMSGLLPLGSRKVASLALLITVLKSERVSLLTSGILATLTVDPAVPPPRGLLVQGLSEQDRPTDLQAVYVAIRVHAASLLFRACRAMTNRAEPCPDLPGLTVPCLPRQATLTRLIKPASPSRLAMTSRSKPDAALRCLPCDARIGPAKQCDVTQFPVFLPVLPCRIMPILPSPAWPHPACLACLAKRRPAKRRPAKPCMPSRAVYACLARTGRD